MVKNLIFDLGNIIIQNPSKDLVKKFFKNEKDAETFYNFIFKSEYWKMMDCGQITGEEVAKQIEDKKLIEVSDYKEIREFMKSWYTECIPNTRTMRLAEVLKERGFGLYILSNMAKETFDYFSKNYEFFSLVNGEVISAQLGVKKPDPGIFLALLKKYDLLPKECLLIDDDDTNQTFETAHALGIKGRRVEPNNTIDIIQLLLENGITLYDENIKEI